MKIAYLHTNPYYQEIENLISDINSNFNSKDHFLFEIQYPDLKLYKLFKLHTIRRFLNKNRIEVIHTYHYLDAYYAMLAAKGLNVKIVYSCYSYHNNLKGFSKMIFERVLAKADAIVFQSEVHKNTLVSKYNLTQEKVFMLYHGFSVDRLDNFKYASLRDEYFIDDFRYLIGTMGDFTPEHNVLNVYKMVKKLRRSGRNFTCIVAGDEVDEYDTYFDECKYYYLIHGLDNYITFAGRRTDTPNFLSQLDVFVYHSDDEAVALPVIEAMLLGVNVVVNDNEMINEITHNFKYATSYQSQDASQFAERTREILLDIDDYKIIAETVKEECREIYSIERHIYGLKNIYNKVKNS